MSLPVAWVGAEELPTLKINQFVAQVDPMGDVFLTVGTITPPFLTAGTPEELRRQAESIPFVPVRGVAKFALSARGMQELISILQTGLEMLEQQEGKER